jgi:hypothetical protein
MLEFKMTFKKGLPASQKETILDTLITNLQGSFYSSIEMVDDNKLIIHGEFYSLSLSKEVPWNLWTGFSKKTEVIINDNEIRYTLDYTYAIINFFLSIVTLPVFLSFVYFALGLTWTFVLYFFIIYSCLEIIFIGIGILQHRNLFLNTLKYGSKYKGKYDWDRILKAKTIEELKNIASGNTTLTDEVQELAKKELASRK